MKYRFKGGENATPFDDKYQIMLDGCWIWSRPNRTGYGKVRRDGAVRWAHRVSYETHRGPIPTGLEFGPPVQKAQLREPVAP